MASGITTFVGQAHGAAEAPLKGLILQRGAAVAAATAMLPLLGWTQLTRLLALLGAAQHMQWYASLQLPVAGRLC
jgi:hypothetical protein